MQDFGLGKATAVPAAPVLYGHSGKPTLRSFIFLALWPLLQRWLLLLQKVMAGRQGYTNKTLVLGMKLTTILLFVACLQVHATGYTQTVTLTVKDAPLEKVFTAIRQQTGYLFFYSDNIFDHAKPVTLQVKNIPVSEMLRLCLKDQPLEFFIEEKTVFVTRKGSGFSGAGISSQDKEPEEEGITVNGKVLNEEGRPVEGITVTIKGTNTATMTNTQGEFSLNNVVANAVLVFSHVTMETVELRVGSKTSLVVTLKKRVQDLKDVTVTVNTGYQQIAKERMVGAYSQLDSAAYNRREGMGILERLDGTVTGLLFDKKSGGLNPIQIRGVSTLGGDRVGALSSPLFNVLIIVDNFPYKDDISTINPNDVENITVLKDAAATSIWGARAGNGVIVITTKKGRYNQAFSVTARTNVAITEKPNLYLYPKMSSSDEIDVEKFLFEKGFYDGKLNDLITHPLVSSVVEILSKQKAGQITQTESDAQINSLRTLDLRSDLDKYVYRKKITNQSYINFSGGNNFINYNFSIGYNHTGSNVQSARANEQFTLNSVANFRPFKKIEIQIGVGLSKNTARDNGLLLPGSLYPYTRLADEEGQPLAVTYLYRSTYLDTVGGGQLLDWKLRPLEEIALADKTTTSRLARLNFGITYRFNSWLNLGIQCGYNENMSGTRNFHSLQSFFTRDLINRFTNLSVSNNPDLRNPLPIGAVVDISNSQSSTISLRGQLNINKNWNRSALTAFIAEELTENNGGYVSSNRLYGYNNRTVTLKDNIDFLTRFPLLVTGNDRIPSGIGYAEGDINRFVSFISNASFTFRDKYTFYASARKDGANIFGVNTNNKWKPLWSTGVRWALFKEPFYLIDLMPVLVLRASFGYSGNSGNIPGYTTIRYFSLVSSLTGLQNASIDNPPNPDLKWEQVRTINWGMDFSLLKADRITGSFDMYSKKSTDLISAIPFDPTTGVTQYTVNSASLKGVGMELKVNSKNTTGRIKWETNYGLSYSKTIVISLYKNGYKASDFITYGLNPAVHKPVYAIAAYRWSGLDPLTGDPQGWLNGHISKEYTNIFNDSIDNQVFKGTTVPLYSMYINNSISWKGISLSINVIGHFGFYFRRPAINYNGLFNGGTGHPDYLRRWQKPGDEVFTNVPSMIYPVPAAVAQRDEFYGYSEINVLKGGNVRIQDFRLQYSTINRNSKNKIFKSLLISLYVNNLNMILWRADRSVYDPDFVGGFSPEAAPPQRTWTLGLNANF